MVRTLQAANGAGHYLGRPLLRLRQWFLPNRHGARNRAAHYAGAVPLDMLKGEMDRLTGEVTDAEAAIRTATKAMTELEQVLDAALLIASTVPGSTWPRT